MSMGDKTACYRRDGRNESMLSHQKHDQSLDQDITIFRTINPPFGPLLVRYHHLSSGPAENAREMH